MNPGGERSGFGEQARRLIGFSYRTPALIGLPRELFNGADTHLLMACKHTESAASATALFADIEGPSFGDPRAGFKNCVKWCIWKRVMGTFKKQQQKKRPEK